MFALNGNSQPSSFTGVACISADLCHFSISSGLTEVMLMALLLSQSLSQSGTGNTRSMISFMATACHLWSSSEAAR